MRVVPKSQRIVVSLLLKPQERLYWCLNASHCEKYQSDEALLHNILALNGLMDEKPKLGWKYLSNHDMINTEDDVSDTPFSDWYDLQDNDEFVIAPAYEFVGDSDDGKKNKNKKGKKKGKRNENKNKNENDNNMDIDDIDDIDDKKKNRKKKSNDKNKNKNKNKNENTNKNKNKKK
eukprot:9577_1